MVLQVVVQIKHVSRTRERQVRSEQGVVLNRRVSSTGTLIVYESQNFLDGRFRFRSLLALRFGRLATSMVRQKRSREQHDTQTRMKQPTHGAQAKPSSRSLMYIYTRP